MSVQEWVISLGLLPVFPVSREKSEQTLQGREDGVDFYSCLVRGSVIILMPDLLLAHSWGGDHPQRSLVKLSVKNPLEL